MAIMFFKLNYDLLNSPFFVLTFILIFPKTLIFSISFLSFLLVALFITVNSFFI